MIMTAYLMTFDDEEVMDIPVLVCGVEEDIMRLQEILEWEVPLSSTLFRAEELDLNHVYQGLWNACREAMAPTNRGQVSGTPSPGHLPRRVPKCERDQGG